jgi:hypothetical protein
MSNGKRKSHAAYALKNSGDNKYRIQVCRSGEKVNANVNDLKAVPMPDLADGIDNFEYMTMAQLFASVGLEMRLLGNVNRELTDSVLDLCNQLVDDYDLMLADLESVGFANAEQQTLVYAVMHAMAQAYSETGADNSGPSAAEHDAAAQICRFLRYVAFLKKTDQSGALNTVAKSNILNSKNWKKEKEDGAARRVTRFIRYAAAIKSGNSVTFTAVFCLDTASKGGGGAKKRSRAVLKIRNAPQRRSMYEGDIQIEGELKKFTSNGLTKRWVSRYFTIRGHYLKYYDNAEKTDVKGVLDLAEIQSARLEVLDFTTRKITLESNVAAPLLLKGPTNVMEEWVRVIDEVARNATTAAAAAAGGGGEEPTNDKEED